MTGRTAVLMVLAAFAAVTVYEVLVAVTMIPLGDLPGEGAPGGELVGLLAGAAVAASAVLAVLLAHHGNAGTPLAALLAPAAAAFMVAHFYTYDAYALPTLVRHSERDFVPPLFVYGLGALAVVVGVVTSVTRSVGLALTAPTILVCGLTAWFTGFGH